MKLLISCLILIASLVIVSTPSFATIEQNTAVNFQPQLNDAWNKIIDRIAQDGELYEDSVFSYLVLSDINPIDRTKSHVANFLTAVGGLDADGKFHTIGFQAVTEYWTINKNGKSEADQWVFTVAQNGEVDEARRIHLTKTPILESVFIPTPAEILLAKWQAIRKIWEGPRK